MTTKELGESLRKMYFAETENRITKILLFGIMYAEEIKVAAGNSSINHVMNEIVDYSKIPSSYSREIKKAVALANYVEVKANVAKL